MKFTVNSQESLSRLIGHLREMFKDKRYFQVVVNPGKGRSLSQNALQHVWALQVSRELSEHTAEEVRCYWKLHFGMPILRGDDEEYNMYCNSVIDPLPYENKIKAMVYWPVTQRMTTKQLSEYLEAVQRHYVGRVALEFPEDD